MRTTTTALAVIVVVSAAACGGKSGGEGDATSGDSPDDGDAGAEVAGDTGPDAHGDPDADAADAHPDPDASADAGGDEAVAPDAADVPDAGDDVPGGWIVPPLAGDPAGDPCSVTGTVEGTWTTYRKDSYLPDEIYDEYTDYPVDGGRFHVASVAAASGPVTSVALDGTDVEDMLVEPLMEWYHVWPSTLVEGEPVWFAFHSRDPAWDVPGASARLTIETAEGTAVDADIHARRTVVPLGYVTTTADMSTILVHVKNTDSAPHSVSRLLVDGRDVTEVASMPRTTLEPQEAALWTVPLCSPATPGDPWTVVVEYEDAETAVGVGRVLPPSFPVETWQNSSECPFPGVDDENHAAMTGAGIDTFHFPWHHVGDCTYDPQHIIDVVAPATEGFELLVTAGFLEQPDPGSFIGDTSGLAGFMTGDESDGEIYEEGVPVPSIKAAKARALWDLYPELPVYNGAKTNGHVGTFAGMTDVQGVDLYVAACAPHITVWGNHPPLRGAYDYLRNTRDNHMPLPTWLYAQGLSPAWNQGDGDIHVQPDPQEILVQAMSVVAAGGKGLMWFQTNQDEAEHRPERWDAIARSSWMVRGVRDHLREGDVTGMVSSDPETLVEMIRAREALVVPIINLSVASNVTDVKCLGALVSEALVPHWILADHAPDVSVVVPDDFGVADVFEVGDRTVLEPSFGLSVSGRVITFSDVPLSNAEPVRLVVLAAHEAVRDDVLAAMNP
jgi:hypothetical protein